MTRRIAAGLPEPLGITPTDGGVNAAIFSAHATSIELCLFDADGTCETARIALPERTGPVHHGFIPDVPPATRYGLRAHGPYEPSAGHRFNPNKLLVDPHATMLDRRFALHPSLFAFAEKDGSGFSTTDSAAHVPKAVVGAAVPASPTGRPRVPWSDTIIYELNLRGFSMRNPRVMPVHRGTFSGLAAAASIEHLVQLGITTVEIMPAAAWIDEHHLAPLGLTNVWGYNPVAFSAPDPLLAPGGWADIAAAVDALHAVGIEVIVDIVLNHSGEGDALGPTVSLRGLDNATYYRLLPGDPARYIDDMGCGNCLALDRPPVVRLAMDTLRTWARTGIDGFRFDLATALGRRPDGFDPAAPLITAIGQDPELRDLKLVAEAWDIGPGGYQVGAFPPAWGEWNDRYRDGLRRFWRGEDGRMGDMATRLAGSQDLFGAKTRPSRGINFATAHDGFTLADLVSYSAKQNVANGEDNRDGTDANHSWNSGAEGPSDDPAVRAARHRDQINLIATLLLSRGTPMLAMGSELGHTQHGNNNAYAQDNETFWLDWSRADTALGEATRALIALRKAQPLLRSDHFLEGAVTTPDGLADARWLRPDGEAMSDSDWNNGETLILILAGRDMGSPGTRRLAIILHRGRAATSIRLPDARAGTRWRRLVDTSLPPAQWPADRIDQTVAVPARTVLAFFEPPARGRTGVPDELVESLADSAGIYRDWWDHSGTNHRVTLGTKQALLAAMGLETTSVDAARHALDRITCIRANPPAPPAGPCHLPEEPARGFGISTQLYALRREDDQGIGDFTTLSRMGREAARAGAITLGINPLHALFPHDRGRASPYQPSDRRFLDPISIDLDSMAAIAGVPADMSEAEAAEAHALAALPMVDHVRVAGLKDRVLRRTFDRFGKAIAAGQIQRPAQAFRDFIQRGGEELRIYVAFQAIAGQQGTAGWRGWPEPLARAATDAVREAARRDADGLTFSAFAQWIADAQLARAAQDLRDAGLTLGLYRDLAVGCAPDGAEIWASQSGYAQGVSIGAPPDPFAANGQNWCLPPPNPIEALATDGALFRRLILANMRHAGVLRIDHVLGLNRLFWIPDGADATEGAYVAQPLDLHLGILAEESRRHRCAVVGEDLGTVPNGFREALAAKNIMSYRVLWFEREGTSFIPPERWPELSVACVSTHDLPTVEGWWRGADIDERLALGLLTGVEAEAEHRNRAADRMSLLAALGREVDDASDPGGPAPMDDALAAAIHGFVGRAGSRLAIAQAEDLAGETIAINLPGTDRERPNWRRKIAIPVEELFGTSRANAILGSLRNRGGLPAR